MATGSNAECHALPKICIFCIIYVVEIWHKWCAELFRGEENSCSGCTRCTVIDGNELEMYGPATFLYIHNNGQCYFFFLLVVVLHRCRTNAGVASLPFYVFIFFYRAIESCWGHFYVSISQFVSVVLRPLTNYYFAVVVRRKIRHDMRICGCGKGRSSQT